MLKKSIIILIFTLECWSDERRQFNHYPEYLQAKALRQQQSGLGSFNAKVFGNKEAEYRGPPRNVLYNPTYGYEPYWKTGDWVFERRKRPNGTGEADSNCGEKCFNAFLAYGPVCARNVNGTYRNFTSICAMKTFDCRGKQGWLIVYKGYCRRYIDSYPYPNTQFLSTRMPITRALSIIDYFSKAYPEIMRDHAAGWERK